MLPPSRQGHIRGVLQHGRSLHGRDARLLRRHLTMRNSDSFNPLSSRSRRPVAAILCTFALSSALTVGLSIRSTSRQQHHAAVFQIAARQRTLAERYVEAVVIARLGERSDPATIAADLTGSADVLLNGGTAPAINGDDDGLEVAAQHGALARRQLAQAQRLVRDLTATGSAMLRHEPLARRDLY